MRVLLDTYVLIRFATAGLDELTERTRLLIERETTERLISTVSLTELAIKTSIGKLKMTRPEIDKAIEDLAGTVIPYGPLHVNKLFDLPLVHREPFDRMLIATALAEDVALVSTDRQFPKYKGLRVMH